MTCRDGVIAGLALAAGVVIVAVIVDGARLRDADLADMPAFIRRQVEERGKRERERRRTGWSCGGY